MAVQLKMERWLEQPPISVWRDEPPLDMPAAIAGLRAELGKRDARNAAEYRIMSVALQPHPATIGTREQVDRFYYLFTLVPPQRGMLQFAAVLMTGEVIFPTAIGKTSP